MSALWVWSSGRGWGWDSNLGWNHQKGEKKQERGKDYRLSPDIHQLREVRKERNQQRRLSRKASDVGGNKNTAKSQKLGDHLFGILPYGGEIWELKIRFSSEEVILTGELSASGQSMTENHYKRKRRKNCSWFTHLAMELYTKHVNNS